MKIPLTRGEETIVDEAYENLNDWEWYCTSTGYAARRFRTEDRVQHTMYMHHAIIGFPLNGKMVDHVDGNTLNNMIENLRIVTNRQNQANQRRRRNGETSSQYVGVFWDRKLKKWRASIKINGQTKYLGSFRLELEAASAYEKFSSGNI